VKHILGIQVNQTTEGISLTQSSYITRTLQELDMASCRPAYLPASGGEITAAIKQAGNMEPVEQTHYQHIVGKLMYAAIATRPDISFTVGFLARYSSDPRMHHLQIAKNLLRYLLATVNYYLFYPATNGKLELLSYSDSDWAGSDDLKSTSGMLTTANGTALTWSSKKQPIVAMSTAEAEYISASDCGLETVWLRRIADDLGFPQSTPTTLLMDNNSSIQMASNHSNHSRTKHIDLRYHKIRELLENNTIAIKYVPTDQQLADIFTKALPKDKLLTLSKAIGLKLPSTV